MDLTPENKAKIDRMTYRELLSRWRFTGAGDPWMQGKTGKYWSGRMRELKLRNPGQAAADSKSLGWN